MRASPRVVCRGESTPLFGVSQPTLSHHLRKRREAGIVEVERRGVWAFEGAPGAPGVPVLEAE